MIELTTSTTDSGLSITIFRPVVPRKDSLPGIIFSKSEGTRQVRISAIRWLDSVGDLKIMGIQSWRQKPQDWYQWKKRAEEAMVHVGLYYQQ
jgi:hypothetical protein